MKPLDLLPSWDTVKKIGGSRTVALAGLFPFVGYLFVANEQFLEWTRLVIDSDEAIHSTRLRMEEIYFALVWLSLGVIAFKLSCPKEISQFQDSYEFSIRELEIAEPIRLKHYQENLPNGSWVKLFQPSELRHAITETQKVKLDHFVSPDAGYFPDIGGHAKSKPSWLADSGREILLCLNTYYDAQNYSHPLLRATTLLAFTVGYVKLSLPAYNVMLALIIKN